MKKHLLCMICSLVATSAFAYCQMPVTLANATIPCASGLSSDPSQVHAYLWLQGKADWTTDNTSTVPNVPGVCAGGCDSDGVDVMDETCMYDYTSILGVGEDCLGSGPGTYYLLTDWSTSPSGIGYDGCPSADQSERAILLIYDDTGKCVLQSKSQSGSSWTGWDEIGTSAAVQLLAPSCYFWEFTNYFYLPYLPNSVTYGSYADGDAPSSPLVTERRIYYYFGCLPPSRSTSAWTAGPSYPVGTTEFYDYDFPSASEGLWVAYALIIDGKDAPFVSDYISVPELPEGTATDDDPCSCTGITLHPNYGGWDSDPVMDALIDGVELLECIGRGGGGQDTVYHGTCGVQHSIQFRGRRMFDGITTCWSDPIYATDTSVANPPVITSVIDNNPYLPSGFNIYFTPGTPAIRHDLYLWGAEGPLLATDFHSGDKTQAYTCHQGWGFSIAAINDTGECQTVFSSTAYGHESCNKPPEIAVGLSESDALLFSTDETTINWQSFFGATGYRLYRGTPADLANLPGGTVDNSCTRYDGTSTSIDLSGDTPTEGSFFWYLVTAYNGTGEGSAGTRRIINSSGACP